MQQKNSSKKGSSLKGFPKLETSPFTVDIKKGTRPVVSSHIGETYHSLTGELLSDNVKIVVSKTLDRSEFIKLFTANLQVFIKISKSEIAVFFYLIKDLQVNTGKTKFDISDCEKFTSLSKPTIYQSLGGLCQKEFIARTPKSYYYWVNPNIAFNGSRMSIIKE